MRMSRALQFFILLVGLCLDRCGHSSSSSSSSREAGQVPVSHMKMLSLGLAHLMQGVEENAGRLEEQGEQVEEDLDTATKSLESLQKQNVQTGRTHRRVRRELQILRAKGDRLWRSIRDLLEEQCHLLLDQGDLELQMKRILQRVESLTEPRTEGQKQIDMSTMK
ncbi:hypothetical protein LDENG_00239080, partial [Lucifuga dentata]